MAPTPDKSSFNLSKWALDHPALTRYQRVVLMLPGVAEYFQLGRDEDPPFTFPPMVVRTYWPSATAQQVAEQVTDKIERTLQEVPYADKIRGYVRCMVSRETRTGSGNKLKSKVDLILNG